MIALFPQEKRSIIFVNTFNSILENLGKTDALMGLLFSLGQSCAKYGVREEHYDWFNLIMQKTLANYLEESWTDDLAQHWFGFINIIAEAMKSSSKKYLSMAAKDTVSQKMQQDEYGASLVEIQKLQLSSEATRHIHNLLTLKVRELIKLEIERCLVEQMAKIEEMSVEDLLAFSA